MKLKKILLSALFAVLIAALPGFAANNQAQVYDGVLRDFKRIIAEGSDENVNSEGGTGVLEAISGKKKDTALASIGYVIKDISGDGIPELLIGAVGRSGRIYAVYTSVDGKPHFTFESWARNSADYMDGGRFFRQGSNGAMYSIFGKYTISRDGTSLRCNDYYFTFEKDRDFKKIGYYHNTSGKWDKAASKELKISAAEFAQIEKSLSKQIAPVELTPFSKYGAAGAKAARKSGPLVHALFEKDGLRGVSAYDSFIAGQSDPRVKVVFSATSAVKDFKVLALSDAAFKDNKVSFKVKELYSQDSLTPGRPLVVTMSFYGDVPNNGISYVDENGKTLRFSVGVSGESGKFVLERF